MPYVREIIDGNTKDVIGEYHVENGHVIALVFKNLNGRYHRVGFSRQSDGSVAMWRMPRGTSKGTDLLSTKQQSILAFWLTGKTVD